MEWVRLGLAVVNIGLAVVYQWRDEYSKAAFYAVFGWGILACSN